MVGGTGIFRGFLDVLLLTVGYGIFCGVIASAFSLRKSTKNHSGHPLCHGKFFFIVECLIMESFQMYMTFGDIKTGAGGVIGGFSENFPERCSLKFQSCFSFASGDSLHVVRKKRLPAKCKPSSSGNALVFGFIISGTGVLLHLLESIKKNIQVSSNLIQPVRHLDY